MPLAGSGRQGRGARVVGSTGTEVDWTFRAFWNRSGARGNLLRLSQGQDCCQAEPQFSAKLNHSSGCQAQHYNIMVQNFFN
jgi:hypothetical protein